MNITSNYFLLLQFCSLCICCISTTANAQVVAPDFLCVTNDTLRWSPNTNDCGPFLRYEVFASQQATGPFSLLTEITDASQGFYWHTTANDQLWYYYLQAIHDCPGVPIITSDTLDNLLPILEEINFISVTENGILLNWTASPSPEVVGYLISRNTNTGTTILDTVFSDTTYLDTSIPPDANIETYFVTAIDGCGNKSLITDPHQTMLLNAAMPDDCDPGIVLSWNNYDGWMGDDFRYELFTSTNGEPYVLADTGASTDRSIIYTQGNDTETICFYVEAVQASTDFRARSSVTCQVLDFIQPLRSNDVIALGASVIDEQTIEIDWIWEPLATIIDANLREVSTNISTNYPIPGMSTLANTAVVPVNGGVTTNTQFEIIADDECGNTVISNPVAPPLLSGQQIASGDNLLEWQPYDQPAVVVVGYELVRENRAGETTVVTQGLMTEFIDLISMEALSDDGFCYYLLVEVLYPTTIAGSQTKKLRSNKVCLRPAINVYVPNVFTPNSANNRFQPFLGFPFDGTYEMKVFNRWGGLVFETEDVTQGWNGYRDNRLQPQGTYIYFIKFISSNGESTDLQGDVLLLH